MTTGILILNAGSSSVKFAVNDVARRVRRVRGAITGLPGRATFVVDSEPKRTDLPTIGPEEAIAWVLDWVTGEFGEADLSAVGHRIVHGGRDFVSPMVLTADREFRLQQLSTLAPLHQPFGLNGVVQARRRFPRALQVGCFDTAFHANRPEVDKLLPLPRELASRGVIRYGFHGLSFEHVAVELRKKFGPNAGGRVVVAHLGAGASLCAMHGGRSVATTMGFTPLGGLPMATRSGDLDPGVILYLLQDEGLGVEQAAELLNRRSGLLGLSGESADLRFLLESLSPRATQTVEYYVGRLAREIAGMAAVLGGLDRLVFTGGVGEHLAEIRARICGACAWIGAELDDEANAAHCPELHAPGSRISILRIAADEEAIIGQHVLSILDVGYPDTLPPS